jgi:hypothetical protein
MPRLDAVRELSCYEKRKTIRRSKDYRWDKGRHRRTSIWFVSSIPSSPCYHAKCGRPVRHAPSIAHFLTPMQALSRTAGSMLREIDECLLEGYHGAWSLSFEPGEHKRIVVGNVDDRVIESLKIIGVG